MSIQQNNFPRCERLGMKLNFMLRKSILAGIAVVVMGTSLVFSGSASAHNIDLPKARELAKEYARGIIKEGRGYINYAWRCKSMFSGHNHYVQCEIEYKTAKDKAAGVYSCKEVIQVILQAHGSSNTHNYSYLMKHTSGNRCGSRNLQGRLCDTDNSCP